MKVLIIANGADAHALKWVTYLSKYGLNIYLFSMNDFDTNLYSDLKNFKYTSCSLDKELIGSKMGNYKKFKYISLLPKLKRIIKLYKPDIVHSHYASGNGFLGALTGFKNYIVSVYGGDVYEFPRKSLLTKKIFEYNLRKAAVILSTSNVMKVETQQYTNKDIIVTPFGIDLEIFKPNKSSISKHEDIIIGTVKKLEVKYGIDILIRAFAAVNNRIKDVNLKLVLIGDGKETENLINLTKELHVNDKVSFIGRIAQDEVPSYLNSFDIYVALSVLDSESFGVAIIEAGACEVPVVVSNVGGLPEVVENNKTGIIVENRNFLEASEAIEKLVLNEKLRKEMGSNARKLVNERYNLIDNVKQMVNIYTNLIKK